ncbi:unnamed protein product, partial [Phaeothamnion confervicola]
GPVRTARPAAAAAVAAAASSDDVENLALGFDPEHFRQPRSKTGRPTYMEMARDAIVHLNDRNGSSLPAIRKWVAINYRETQQKQKASFNSLTLKALSRLVSEGVLDKTKGSFRFTDEYMREALRRERDTAVARGGTALLKFQAKESALGKGKGADTRYGGGAFERFEHNKGVRKELEASRLRRDAFLGVRRAVLMPFMQDGDNYFTRIDREAILKKMDTEEEEEEPDYTGQRSSRDSPRGGGRAGRGGDGSGGNSGGGMDGGDADGAGGGGDSAA